MRTIQKLTSTAITDFLGQVDPPLTGEELFDQLSDVVYVIKDINGAYLVVNQTLVLRCRMKDKRQLLGRTPVDVLQPPLGQQFAAQDQQVLRTGVPLLSQLELHVHPSGAIGWCLTTKLPLRNDKRQVIGLMGVSQDLRLPNVESDEYRQVGAAIRFAEQHVATPPSIDELAHIAEMSTYQLARRMHRVFGLSTGQWLLKVRLDKAQRLLRETDTPIGIVAQEAGYSDQCAFSRHFRRATGLTPREYRATWGRQTRVVCLSD